MQLMVKHEHANLYKYKNITYPIFWEELQDKGIQKKEKNVDNKHGY